MTFPAFTSDFALAALILEPGIGTVAVMGPGLRHLQDGDENLTGPLLLWQRFLFGLGNSELTDDHVLRRFDRVGAQA